MYVSIEGGPGGRGTERGRVQEHHDAAWSSDIGTKCDPCGPLLTFSDASYERLDSPEGIGRYGDERRECFCRSLPFLEISTR